MKNSASSWLFTRTIPRCAVNKTLKKMPISLFSNKNPVIRISCISGLLAVLNNPLTPNDHYSGRTTPLTSKRCILYIYSTNIDTEYLNMVYTLRYFSLQNSGFFIILTYLVPVLFTFNIQGVLKF